MVLGQHQKLSSLFNMDNAKWDSALVTELSYQLEGYNVNCDLLIIMTDDSLKRLFKKLDYLLA